MTHAVPPRQSDARGCGVGSTSLVRFVRSKERIRGLELTAGGGVPRTPGDGGRSVVHSDEHS